MNPEYVSWGISSAGARLRLGTAFWRPTLGIHAVQALLDGQSGVMVGEVKGEITYTPLRETWEKQKHPNGDLHALAKLLCA